MTADTDAPDIAKLTRRAIDTNPMPLDSKDSIDSLEVHGFEKLQRIGRGSQGVVFKARHKTTGELAVVKTFVGENSAIAGYREAWALYKLHEAGPHPNIVGYHSCSACGSHLVLNYIDGVDLLDVVQQQGGVKGGALVSLFAQMYAGVRHMYAVAMLVPSIGRLACAA